MSDFFGGLACLNGHELTGYLGVESGMAVDKFCPECGEPTVSQCKNCQTAIRGKSTDGLDIRQWRVARHCHSCGTPYPWTQRKTEALAEVILELDEVSVEEREKLQRSIPDIVAQTPRSETAALRFKKTIGKISGASGRVLMEVLKNVAAEGVKKLLGM